MDDDAILDEIEATRATNNACWMSIVRIALKSSPEETRRILRGILWNDKKNLELLGQLIDD